MDDGANERDRPHGCQLTEREFQAERKEQQHDTQLGELLDAPGVFNRWPARERTNHHAGQDVADYQRLFGALRQEPANQRSDKDEREVGDESDG